MKNILYVTSILIFFMGSAHILLTPATYNIHTLEALWFAGSGLALIILSFLMYALVTDGKKNILYILGHISNLTSVIFVGFILNIVFAPHILFLFIVLLIQFIVFIIFHVQKYK